jgi:hypothetical protein
VRSGGYRIGFALAILCLAGALDDIAAAEAPTKAGVPSVTVIGHGNARGILGTAVKDAEGHNMGRIVDVIVNRAGSVRAAIVDFGGFLGVGSRKIAVAWNALEFGGAVKPDGDLKLALTRDQLKAAPEYKEGKPVVVIGLSGALGPLDMSGTSGN